jgi:hypothetical protein
VARIRIKLTCVLDTGARSSVKATLPAVATFFPDDILEMSEDILAACVGVVRALSPNIGKMAPDARIEGGSRLVVTRLASRRTKK